MSSMNEYLTWALNRARAHTLALVADVPPAAMRLQAIPGERHPALADSYLLSLLGAQPRGEEFALLLEGYGPASLPPAAGPDHTKDHLVDGLRQTHAVRIATVRAMTDRALARPTPDARLADRGGAGQGIAAQLALAHREQPLR